MHIQSLTKLELGEREPTWATVQDLAAALGVSCEAFTQEPAASTARLRGRPSKAAPAVEPKPENPSRRRDSSESAVRTADQPEPSKGKAEADQGSEKTKKNRKRKGN